jgi:hypothetical protein
MPYLQAGSSLHMSILLQMQHLMLFDQSLCGAIQCLLFLLQIPHNQRLHSQILRLSSPALFPYNWLPKCQIPHPQTLCLKPRCLHLRVAMDVLSAPRHYPSHSHWSGQKSSSLGLFVKIHAKGLNAN